MAARGEGERSGILQSRIGRRDFLSYCAVIAAGLGLGGGAGSDSTALAANHVAEALEDAAQKKPMIWLEAQACGGCLQSVSNSASPELGRIILELVSLRFSQALSSPSDEKLFAQADSLTDHLLLVEGSIPLAAGGRYCLVGRDGSEPITAAAAVRRMADKAAVVVAAGTCAAYGGIPSASGGGTGATGLVRVLPKKNLVLAPGCPPHPDWVVGTLTHMLLFGTAPARDADGRPVSYYSSTVHSRCDRRAAFDEGRFLGSFSEAVAGDDRCLLHLGCKGPVAHADCPTRQWNSGVNWCVGGGGPCIGCTEPAFFEGLSPALERLPDVIPYLGGYRVTIDGIAKGAVGVSVAAIAGHAAFTGIRRLRETRRVEAQNLTDTLTGVDVRQAMKDAGVAPPTADIKEPPADVPPDPPAPREGEDG